MKKWEKKIVALGVVFTIVLLIRRATKDDVELKQIKVKDVSKQLPRSKTKQYSKRELLDIDQIIVHHSATSGGSPTSFARHHVQTRGWPGIGYHYVISKDGKIYQTNDLDAISYHTSGQNSRSIGICLTGNYDEEKPPSIQLQQCAQLILALDELLFNDLVVLGHRDFSAKSCPGDNFDLDHLKSMVAAYRNEVRA
ncbi:MAG: peptidoglycan recognition family protein [Bacteroidota bacterium]